MILRIGNNKYIRNVRRHQTLRFAVVAYEVLVVALFARVPHTPIYGHSEHRIVLVLKEFVLVFWHQKNNKNARQSDSM